MFGGGRRGGGGGGFCVVEVVQVGYFGRGWRRGGGAGGGLLLVGAPQRLQVSLDVGAEEGKDESGVDGGTLLVLLGQQTIYQGTKIKTVFSVRNK
jgi:hypothetical protein